jgi:iron complex outermembrane receptor protein
MSTSETSATLEFVSVHAPPWTPDLTRSAAAIRRHRSDGQGVRVRTDAVAAALLLSVSGVLGAHNASADANAAAQNDPPTDTESAQKGASGQLKTVIVTATKTAQNVQNVPTSIQVVTAAQLASAQTNTILDLPKQVPGFTIDQSSYQLARATFSIRGVGTVSNGQMVQPSVGVVVDGVTIDRSGASILDFDDIARIEVLRGPQGTLFGKNTSAGVLNIVTQDPTSTTTANLGVMYGSYNEVRVHGTLSGSLIDDSLLGSVSFFDDNRDGYITNIYNGARYNDDHERGIRGKLLFQPAPGTRIRVIGDWSDISAHCCAEPLGSTAYNTSLPVLGEYPGFAFPSGFINERSDEVDILPVTRPSENDTNGLSVQVDQDLGQYTLTSISAYRTWFADWDIPYYSTSPIPLVDPDTDTHGTGRTHTESEELRIASPKGGLVDYVAGIFLYQDRLFQTEHFKVDLATIAGTPVGADMLPGGDWASHGGDDNYAAFGEAHWHLASNWTLITGVRETYEKVSLNLGGIYIGGSPLVTDTAASVTSTSWKTGLQWNVTTDAMAYATVARGFKGPGYDDKQNDAKVVKPEIVDSYEMGWKSEEFNHTLRTNADVFLMNIHDFQAQSVLLNPATNLFTELFVNAGEMRTQGLELDVESLLGEHLSVDVNGAYTDTKFISFPGAPCWTSQTAAEGCTAQGTQNLAGHPNALVPKYSFNWDATYTTDIPWHSLSGFFRVGYSYRSAVEWNILGSPDSTVGGYGELDASIGISSQDDRIHLSVFGKNLTNKFIQEGGYLQYFLPPDYHTIGGVTLDYKF